MKKVSGVFDFFLLSYKEKYLNCIPKYRDYSTAEIGFSHPKKADEHADSFWSDSKNVIIFFLGCEKKLFQQWSSLQCIQIYGSIVLKGIMLCNSALTKRLLL